MALNTFGFNGLNLTTNEITVLQMPEKISPNRSGKFITIKGRDGYLFIDDGSWEPIPVAITFLVPDNDTYIADIKSKLIGEGSLTLSTAPDGFYKARVVSGLSFGYWLNQRIATVEFIVQPFLYLTAGQSQVILFNGQNYTNAGNVESQPHFIIVGSGVVTVTINTRSFTIDMGGVSKTVWVETPMLEAYDSVGSVNNDMTGDFPYLSIGNNNISWTGTVTSVKMYPYTKRR